MRPSSSGVEYGDLRLSCEEMAAVDDPKGTSSRLDLEKLAAAYFSKISYFDVLNVEAHYHMETSLCSGSSDLPNPIQWVMLADWSDLAYEELLSTNNTCLRDLINIEARVKGLLTQSPESADKYEPLKIFLEEYMKFLSLSKADFVGLSKNKCYLLMTLIKSFTAQFEDSLSPYEYGKQLISLGDLSQIPELQQQMVIKVMSTNPSVKTESAFSDSACQSEWVRLDDWHDLAHRELKCLRRVYLPQLFKAYERICGLWFKNLDMGTNFLAVKIFLLEFCKFLTLSRAEIAGLSKGECYVLMMLIKNMLWRQLLPTGSQFQIPELQDELDIRVLFVDPSSRCEPASDDPIHLIQSEWDLLAYQELKSLRNKYSSQLDKVLSRIYGLWSQSSLSKEKYRDALAAIAGTVNFSAKSRACILDMSEEWFNDNMRVLQEMVKNPRICPDQPEKLQSKSKRRKLRTPCRKSKIPVMEQPVNNQENPSSKCEAQTDSAGLIQSERFTNLNDQYYEKLQMMKKRYMPILLKAYNKLRLLGPGLYRKEKEGLRKCFQFLELTRSALVINLLKQSFEESMDCVETYVNWSKKKLNTPECSTIEQSSFGYREVERNLYEMD